VAARSLGVPLSSEDVVMSRRETELARLVEQQVLSASQAEELVDAARAEWLDTQLSAEPPPRSTPKGSAVLEVLGYVGGALVLGAVIMLGTFFWDAIGLVAAGAVLIGTVIVLSRLAASQLLHSIDI
jgi:hypothetical protein